MSHALKSKPQPDAAAGARKGVRLSLASIPALTQGGKVRLRAAARNPGKRHLPELPEWHQAGSKQEKGRVALFYCPCHVLPASI